MKCKNASIVLLLIIFHCITYCQKTTDFNKYFSNITYNEYFFCHSGINLALSAWSTSSIINVEFQNGFLIKELSTKSLYFSLQKKSHVAQAELSHTGGVKMGDLRTSLGYGKRFGDRFAFAIRFYYFLSHAQGYQALHSFSFDLSLGAKIATQWYLGISVFNPAHLKYGVVGNEYIPMRFNVDLIYTLSEKILLNLSIQKELAGAIRINAGGYFALNKQVFIHFECSVPTPAIQLGINLLWRSLRIRFASKYQFMLGLSPLCGVSYVF